MKNIDSSELYLVSGGTQYIELTSKLIIDGISDSCIEDFYHANASDLASMLPDNIAHNILKYCSNNLSKVTSIEFLFTSMTRVNE